MQNTAHWRDSARPVKFFFLEGEAVFPFFILIVHWSYLTFGIAVIATLFFTILSHYGLNMPTFFRVLRGIVAGKRKYAHPWWLE